MRRLVVVSSMSSRGKTNIEEDTQSCVEQFFVYSWTLEECKEAVTQNEFFNNVKQNLDASAAQNVSTIPSDAVVSKFHFAGGSSRFMFGYCTSDVISLLDNSVTFVSEVLPYLKGKIVYCSENVINRLFSCYKQNGNPKPAIVSNYAATLLAMKEGPGLIANIASWISADRNPSMDGWLLEMWFFASLRKGGLKLYHRGNNNTEHWTESVVDTFDVSRVQSIPDDATWWKPIKWNQGGYDAIYTEKRSGTLRVVQVASGVTHSFKIEHFYQVAGSISSFYPIQTFEIIFVVDNAHINDFQIRSVSGQGLLQPFGWHKNKETNYVKVVGVDGWRTNT